MNIPMTTAIDKIYPNIQWNIKESSWKDSLKRQSSRRDDNADYLEKKEKLIGMLGWQRKYSQKYYAEKCGVSESTVKRWKKEHEGV